MGGGFVGVRTPGQARKNSGLKEKNRDYEGY